MAVGLLLVFELLPAPRTLHSADGAAALPARGRGAPAGVVLLELPYGVRDGTSSVGNFTARTQFYQTAHGKAIMGGYLSRVSRWRLDELRADPVRNALAILSENGDLTPTQEAELMRGGPAYIRGGNIAFVVIDRDQITLEYQGLAIKAFRLRHIETNGPLSLYAPDVAGGG